MEQKHLNPANEFGPTQAAPLAGNAQAAAVAAKSASVLETIAVMESLKLTDLPTTEERLLALADAIEREALVRDGIGFNMATWNMRAEDYPKNRGEVSDQLGHSCGTVACIAGWADAMENGATRMAGINDDLTPRRAQRILGIQAHEAHSLFYADDASPTELQNISAKRAVAVLRDFAASGSVRWYAFDNQGNRK